MSFHLLAYVSFAVVVVILLLLLAEFVQRVTLLAAALENQKKENTELRKAVKRTTKDLFAKAFEHDRCKAELEEQLSGNELAIEDLKLDHSRLNNRIQDLERNLRLEHSSTVCLQQRYDSLRAFNQYLQDALRERDLKAEEAGRRVLAAAGRADQAARDQTKEVYERMIQRLEMDSLEKIADIRRTASDAEAKLLKEKMSNLELACCLAEAERLLNAVRPPTPPRSATPPGDAPFPLKKTSLTSPTLARSNAWTSSGPRRF